MDLDEWMTHGLAVMIGLFSVAELIGGTVCGVQALHPGLPITGRAALVAAGIFLWTCGCLMAVMAVMFWRDD